MTEFIDIEHHYLDYQGSKIHFVTCGNSSNPPLFLLHSFYMSWAIFRPYLPALVQRFFIVVPDFPGFGDSMMLVSVNDTKGYCLVLNGIRKFIKAEKISLFGFSAGGVVALKYASLYPENVYRLCEQGAPYFHKDYKIIMRDRLILWASVWPAIPKFLQWLARWHFIWPILRRVSKNLDNELKVLEKGRLEADVAQIKVRAGHEWGRDILNVDLRRDLPNIKCPTLILACGRDPYLTVDSIKRMVGYFSISPVLDVASGADHELTLKNIEYTTSKIISFCSP